MGFKCEENEAYNFHDDIYPGYFSSWCMCFSLSKTHDEKGKKKKVALFRDTQPDIFFPSTTMKYE